MIISISFAVKWGIIYYHPLVACTETNIQDIPDSNLGCEAGKTSTGE
jgi:hypothetical protein